MKTNPTAKPLFFDAIRIYLAVVFLVYAKNKLLQDQFIFSPELLSKPIKDVSLLDLQWYIYSFEPFNRFIGISQLVTVFMLLFRKTVFYGAIIFFVIILNILIIDLAVMEGWVRIKMVSKVVFLLGLDLILLSYYKQEIKKILNFDYAKFKSKLSIRYTIFVVLTAILFNCLSIFPKYIYILFKDPSSLKDVFIYDIKDSIYMFKLIWYNYFNR